MFRKKSQYIINLALLSALSSDTDALSTSASVSIKMAIRVVIITNI